jgi:hypothetical protein
MKSIAWVAALFFLTSYFLPAFDTAVGYECALACIQHGDHPYFQAFVLTNVLFVGLVLGVFWMQRFGRVRWLLSLVLLLHTFSWLCFYAWPDLQRHTIDNLRQFHIGYYFWLLAYALLFWAHCLKGPVPNQSVQPMRGSRYAHIASERQWRLPRMADAHR